MDVCGESKDKRKEKLITHEKEKLNLEYKIRDEETQMKNLETQINYLYKAKLIKTVDRVNQKMFLSIFFPTI